MFTLTKSAKAGCLLCCSIMGDKSAIEWSDATWNPVTGCSKVSPGCKNCYAERLAARLQAMGNPRYKNGFATTLHPDQLSLPLRLPCPDNMWQGVSIENADYTWRIAHLVKVPAAVRFHSVEPLLGPIPKLPLKGIS